MTIETAADAGMVSTQAQTIRVATPQGTAERRYVLPTPTIARDGVGGADGNSSECSTEKRDGAGSLGAEIKA